MVHFLAACTTYRYPVTLLSFQEEHMLLSQAIRHEMTGREPQNPCFERAARLHLDFQTAVTFVQNVPNWGRTEMCPHAEFRVEE